MSMRPLALLLLLAALSAMACVAFSGDDNPPVPEPPADTTPAEAGEQDPIASAPAATGAGGRTTIGDLDAAPSQGFVRGRITGPGGARLSGAKVRLVEAGGFLVMGLPRAALAEGMTACRADGSFSLPAPEGGGSYSVAALAPGYGAARAAVVDFEAPVNLELTPSVMVAGEVVDVTGAPVADAVVHLTGSPDLDGLPEAVVTGADGAFGVEAPGAGDYQLLVRSSAGDDAKVDPLRVVEGMEPLRVQVSGAGGVIARIHERDGSPVEGARVSMRPTTPGAARYGAKMARSDANGVARILGVERGSWLVTVTAAGYSEVLLRHSQRDAGPVQIPVEMSAPGSITAYVVDRDGMPAGDFEVQIHGSSPQLRMQPGAEGRRTDDAGKVVWKPIAAGRYRLVGGGDGWQVDLEGALEGGGDATAKKDGFGASVVEVEVLPGAEVETQLQLMGHARLRVEVIGAAGPVVGAEVLLHRRGVAAAHPASSGVTGPDGVAVMPPVRPNRYQSTVMLDGGAVQVMGEEVVVDQATKEVRILLPTGEVTGRLETSDGPLAGATVQVGGAGAPGTQVVTGPDGAYRVPYLKQGEYLLKATVQGYLPWQSDPFSCDGQTRVDLGAAHLHREALLQGKVLGLEPETQQGFSFRLVELHDTQGVRVGISNLEAGDRFRFQGLVPGSYNLVVVASNRKYDPVTVELDEGMNETEIQVP